MRCAANSRASRSALPRRPAAAAGSPAPTSNDSSLRGAQPSNLALYSRSAPSPSAATRAQISITTARSLLKRDRSSPRRDIAERDHEPASNRSIFIGLRNRGRAANRWIRSAAQASDQRLDRGGPGFQARLVRDEARGGGPKNGRDAQLVLAQGAAGGRQVDDPVDEADLGRQLNRSVKPDNLDRLAVRLKPRRRGSGVFRRDTEEGR